MNATQWGANLHPGVNLPTGANLHPGANCAHEHGLSLSKCVNDQLEFKHRRLRGKSKMTAQLEKRYPFSSFFVHASVHN